MEEILTTNQRAELLRKFKTEPNAVLIASKKLFFITYHRLLSIYFLAATSASAMSRAESLVYSPIHILAKDSIYPKKKKQQLSDYLQSKTCMDLDKVVANIQTNFYVIYSISGVTALLHTLSFSHKKVNAVLGKTNREAQKLFIKAYLLLQSINEKIYFMDCLWEIGKRASVYFKLLYKIEEDISGRSPEKRFEVWQEKSKTIILEMKEWIDLKRPKVPPKSVGGKALSCFCNEYEYPIRFI